MALRGSSPQKNLGLRIKELRVERGITQEELAESCGMFRTYMSRIESGRANPTLTMLYVMADALQVDVRDLLQLPTGEDLPSRVRSTQNLSRGRVQR